jgi:hypothetical protein
MGGGMTWDSIRDAAEKIAATTNSDVILYNGKIEWQYDHSLLDVCEAKHRENALLVLVTFGGDADAAYRIARHLRAKYKKFRVLTPSYCKSAGTLLVIGASELVMTDSAELGPLDVQMSKPDELDEFRSGFIINDAFASLQREAIDTFTHCLLDLKKKTGANITLKTAMQTAGDLTGALFSGLYAQIDPMHIGEAYRAGRVALEYAKRLNEGGMKVAEDVLVSLVSGYPSHSFVIDRAEATKLLGKKVRPATEDEFALVTELDLLAKFPFASKSGPIVEQLSLSKEEYENAAAKEDPEEHNAEDASGTGESGGGGGGEANGGAAVTPIRSGG